MCLVVFEHQDHGVRRATPNRVHNTNVRIEQELSSLMAYIQQIDNRMQGTRRRERKGSGGARLARHTKDRPRYYVRVLDNRGFGQPDPA